MCHRAPHLCRHLAGALLHLVSYFQAAAGAGSGAMPGPGQYSRQTLLPHSALKACIPFKPAPCMGFLSVPYTHWGIPMLSASLHLCLECAPAAAVIAATLADRVVQ